MKKVFLDAIFFVLHIYYCFLLEKNKNSKVLNGTSTARLRNPAAGRHRDQMMGRSGHVRVMSVMHAF